MTGNQRELWESCKATSWKTRPFTFHTKRELISLGYVDALNLYLTSRVYVQQYNDMLVLTRLSCLQRVSTYSSLTEAQVAGNGTRKLCTPQAIPVQTELGTVKQLLLPSRGEKCSFSLRSNQSVKQLISSIREEDPEVATVVITDSDGRRLEWRTVLTRRISHLAKLGELKNEFQIRVDNTIYEVKLTTDERGANVLTNNEVLDMCTKAYYRKIRQKLSNDKRHHMPFKYVLTPMKVTSVSIWTGALNMA